tara:strand:- start:355 stop:765 length:411 start_codon:yes stop_codon:yes gene_type:complete
MTSKASLVLLLLSACCTATTSSSSSLVLDAVCGDVITSLSHAISVPSAEAVAGSELDSDAPVALQTFLNPMREKFRLATFAQAQHLKPVGAPSTESSFFPGMQWTALHTMQCDTFAGWLFEPAPSAFFFHSVLFND